MEEISAIRLAVGLVIVALALVVGIRSDRRAAFKK